MVIPFLIRPTTLDDATAVDALLGRSYAVLLAPDYDADILAAALPGMTRAKPDLLTSGTYFIAVNAQDQVIATGGWTKSAPTDGLISAATGHVRHVATDPACLRAGLGRALMAVIMTSALRAGVCQMACLSTRTAVPFYRAMGFIALRPINVELQSGAVFPAIEMKAELTL